MYIHKYFSVFFPIFTRRSTLNRQHGSVFKRPKAAAYRLVSKLRTALWICAAQSGTTLRSNIGVAESPPLQLTFFGVLGVFFLKWVHTKC